MSDVFISYSRNDSEFVRRLVAELKSRGQNSWVDWEDIPISTIWLEEIRQGIDEANNFVFVVSPDSISSRMCQYEIAYAISVSKPIFPIMIRYVSTEEMPDDLRIIQNIYLIDDKRFTEQFDRFFKELNTNIEWKKEHRRLLILTRQWQTNNYNSSYLLSENNLNDLDNIIKNVNTNELPLSNIHRQFIDYSRTKNFEERNRTGLQLVANANLLLYKDPGEALGLALQAHDIVPKLNEVETALKNSLKIIDRRFEVSQADRLNWDTGSAFVPLAGAYFKGKLPAKQSPRGDYTLIATERGEHGNNPPGDAYLLNNETLKLIHLEPPDRKGMKRRLEYLGFGSSQKLIYLARQFNIEIFSIEGDFKKEFYVSSTKYPISFVDGVNNDQILVVGDSTGPVWIIDAKSENCYHMFFNYQTDNPLVNFVLSPSKKVAAMLLNGGQAYLWNIEKKRDRIPPQIHHEGKVQQVIFNPKSGQDEIFMTCGYNGNVSIWDIRENEPQLLSDINHGGESIEYANFLLETGDLITVTTSKIPHIWDIYTGKLIQTV